MEKAILLALAATFCTATSSVCQRLGAKALEVRGGPRHGFDALLVFRLARQPVWLLGFASMLAGFALQVSALHFGPLALVQPILAVELLFVFSYLAVLTRCRGVGWREWLAAAMMSAGISVFLRAASPSGGQPHAAALSWWVAGMVTLAAVLLAIAVGSRGSPWRRAAWLGIATGVSWGFIAAVIKELSSHIAEGPGALFGNWSVYVLMTVGAATLLLTSHAMTAGPLAASQPGFTILDPVTAVLLGVLLFGERLQTAPGALAAQVLGLLVLAAGVSALSRSQLIGSHPAARAGPQSGPRVGGELARKARQ